MSSTLRQTAVIQSAGHLLIFFDGVNLQESMGQCELFQRIDVSSEEICSHAVWFEFLHEPLGRHCHR